MSLNSLKQSRDSCQPRPSVFPGQALKSFTDFGEVGFKEKNWIETALLRQKHT